MLHEARPLPPPARPWRWVWVAAGVLSLACGLVGLFLPLLPTVPFVLLAAACFSRGSARLEAWLLAHPRCGPWIHAWRANRAVPRRAKYLATLMMTASCLLAAWRAPAWAAAVATLICVAVALWLWRLPDARR